MIIIGIDPSNECTGVSIWEGGRLLSSTHYNPWRDRLLDFLDFPTHWRGLVKNRMYVEVPQHGTHTSRGGVHWAGGMVTAELLGLCTDYEGVFTALQVGPPSKPGKYTKKITPDTWRRGWLHSVFSAPSTFLAGVVKGWTKDDALMYARRYKPEVESHDEAEAILIGAYGCIDRGIEINRGSSPIKTGQELSEEYGFEPLSPEEVLRNVDNETGC